MYQKILLLSRSVQIMKNNVPWPINKKHDLWIYSSDDEIESQEENTKTLPEKTDDLIWWH